MRQLLEAAKVAKQRDDMEESRIKGFLASDGAREEPAAVAAITESREEEEGERVVVPGPTK